MEPKRDPEKPTPDSALEGKDLMAGFDDALQPQEKRTTAYRVVSPFADDPSTT